MSNKEKLDLIITMMGQFDNRLKQTHRAVLDTRAEVTGLITALRADMEEGLLALNNRLDIHNAKPHP